MGLSNELSCEADSFSCCCLNPHRCFQSEVCSFISPLTSPGLHGLFRFPLFLPVYLCMNVGLQGPPATTLWGLPAAAWLVPLHSPPPRWICQLPLCHKSSTPQLPISAPSTVLDECFFFISLVVGLPVQFSVSSGCFSF